jgi:glycosyltransferase involved in cell wall biosynthesis
MVDAHVSKTQGISSRRSTPSGVPERAIALDASLLGGRTTGIGLYTEKLIAALARGGLRDRLLALGGRSSRLPRGLHHVPARSGSRSAWMIGEVPQLLSSQGVAVFHGMANFLMPLRRPGRTRLVLTVHDLIPLTHPETVSRPFRLQFGAWLSRSLSVTDRVICNSETTRRALLDRYPQVSAEVIHHGVDHVPSRDRLAPPGPTDKPYFLYVGALDARKNLPALMDAFDLWCDRNPGEGTALALAGSATFGSGPVLEAVERLRRRGRDVRLLGHLPSARLWSLMAGARLLSCPSSYEGFSLPPLEALALGVPVVASDIEAHREVLGDAALLISPDSVEALADAFTRIVSDRLGTESLRKRGLERAAGFTWQQSAEKTEKIYLSLIT